jgi:homoserine O-succinyltransferase
MADIVIGLVNNMPDPALRTTEYQVRGVLARSSHKVTLRIFTLPDVPRPSEIGRITAASYDPIENLYNSPIRGVIVTGTEPKTPNLTDEPYWAAMSRLIDWCSVNTVSTIWSCLAAHAAAYQISQIERAPLDGKLYGLFDIEKVTDHPLLHGLDQWRTPHSRLNELPIDDLLREDFTILSRSRKAGADIFVKDALTSLFVFMQGHPEYDAKALFGEYRRDVRRYLLGEAEVYPELPHGYFSSSQTPILEAFRRRAMRNRSPALIDKFPAGQVGRNLPHSWSDSAARFYSNWLGYVDRGN